jgi:hypothetical protein
MPNIVAEDEARQLICSYRNNDEQLKIISDTHRSYDPLAYPLFYPRGTDSWSLPYLQGISKVTLSKYLAYHTAPRANQFNVLHHGRKLFQQWVVDQYCKMETQRLRWIRQHQKTIRAELYQGLQDALRHNNLENLGSAVILPASVTGSPRFMHQKCQDALALCGRFGKPHLLITGTTNPDWPEIKAQLQQGRQFMTDQILPIVYFDAS